MTFVCLPLTSLFNVLERQREELLFSLAFLISRIVVLTVGGSTGDPILTLTIYSGAGVIFYGWLYFYLLRLAGISVRTGISIPVRYLFFGALAAIPLLGAKVLHLSGTLYLIIVMIVAILYYVPQLVADPMLRHWTLLLFRGGGR
jgi:hypothetical protein